MARARPFVLTPPVVREHPLQRQIADVLRLEIAPAGKVSKAGVVWYSIDIADYGGTVPGTRVARGIIAGIPDTFLLFRGRAHLIEVKAVDGTLEQSQRSVISAAICGGARVAVVRDATEVLAVLDEWRIPRNRRVI
jgi:hypothetical protein